MAVRANVVPNEARDAELLLEHRAYVLRLCRILLRDSDESEDAAQQTLLNAHRALADGVRPLEGRAWLAQIARNECRSRMRRTLARTESPLPDGLPAAGADPVELVARQDLLARLREELAELPDRQRRAVLLREFRGLSYDELATEMAETGPAVESLLRRARRRLAKRLVPAALALDWARNVLARIRPGPAASEAAAAGSGAAIVAKLAAAGVVAVGVSVGGSDPQRHASPPSTASPVPRVPPAVASSRSTSRRIVVAAPQRQQGRRSSHGGPSSSSGRPDSRSEGSGPGGHGGTSSSAGPGPAAPPPESKPAPAPEPSGSTSSGPGPGTAEPVPNVVESGHDGAEAPAEVQAIEADHSGPGRGGSSSRSDDTVSDSGSVHGGSGSSGSGK